MADDKKQNPSLNEAIPAGSGEATNQVVDIDALEIKIFILAANPHQFHSVGSFLTRRGWHTQVTGSMSEAIKQLTNEVPDFVLLSVNHSSPNIMSFPNLLAQTFNCTVVAFAEKTDHKTMGKLNSMRVQQKILGPVSGPTIQRKLKLILAERYGLTKEEPSRPTHADHTQDEDPERSEKHSSSKQKSQDVLRFSNDGPKSGYLQMNKMSSSSEREGAGFVHAKGQKVGDTSLLEQMLKEELEQESRRPSLTEDAEDGSNSSELELSRGQSGQGEQDQGQSSDGFGIHRGEPKARQGRGQARVQEETEGQMTQEGVVGPEQESHITSAQSLEDRLSGPNAKGADGSTTPVGGSMDSQNKKNMSGLERSQDLTALQRTDSANQESDPGDEEAPSILSELDKKQKNALPGETSNFVKVIQKAFAKSCAPAKNRVRHLTTVDVLVMMPVETTTLKGFFVVATALDENSSRSFAEKFRANVKTMMANEGLIGTVELERAISVAPINFVERCQASFPFLMSGESGDFEVALAFFNDDSQFPQFKESTYPEKSVISAVHVDEILPVTFSTYIRLEENDKFVEFLRPGSVLSAERQQRILKRQVVMMIDKTSEGTFLTYFYRARLERALIEGNRKITKVSA